MNLAIRTLPKPLSCIRCIHLHFWRMIGSRYSRRRLGLLRLEWRQDGPFWQNGHPLTKLNYNNLKKNSNLRKNRTSIKSTGESIFLVTSVVIPFFVNSTVFDAIFVSAEIVRFVGIPFQIYLVCCCRPLKKQILSARSRRPAKTWWSFYSKPLIRTTEFHLLTELIVL